MNSFIWRKKNITGGGGSITSLSADLNANSHKITNLGAPTANGDAVNKQYVDQVAGQRWYKLAYISSNVKQPNQTTVAQVIDFTNYDLRDGMFSFIVKAGVSGHDYSMDWYGVVIPDGNYSVLTNSLYVASSDNAHGFYIKIERVTNHQIKLWFHSLNGNGFTVSYWGVYVKREGDLISLV